MNSRTSGPTHPRTDRGERELSDHNQKAELFSIAAAWTAPPSAMDLTWLPIVERHHA